MKWTVVVKPKIDISTKRFVDEIKTIDRDVIVKDVYIYKLYCFSGKVSFSKVYDITNTLIIDPVVENFEIYSEVEKSRKETKVNIWYKPEVLDVEALYVRQAIKYILPEDNFEVHTGKRVIFIPRIMDKKKIIPIIEKIFMNPLIQTYEII
ncbi:MAG: phosphoribosylformylglycinamidine synthase subunit PurS [Elusimicrobiota bacterium]|nr:phosphoribosylformylglycinamidine synthase subunit PurS [Elusimicrobiota bacterium]